MTLPFCFIRKWCAPYTTITRKYFLWDELIVILHVLDQEDFWVELTWEKIFEKNFTKNEIDLKKIFLKWIVVREMNFLRENFLRYIIVRKMNFMWRCNVGDEFPRYLDQYICTQRPIYGSLQRLLLLFACHLTPNLK